MIVNVVPHPFGAGDIDPGPVPTHELLHEREADTGPLVRSAPRVRHAMESIKDLRQLVGGNADARVRDVDDRRIPPIAHADGDATVERVLEGVGQEIEYDLLPHLPVDVDARGQERRVHVERESRAVGGRAEGARQFRRAGGQIDRLVGRRGASGLGCARSRASS